MVDAADPRSAPRFAYTLKSWKIRTAWHSHGKDREAGSFESPLCPTGLMLVPKRRFTDLGGFWEAIRKWGGTDVEISLNHYYQGGSSLVDPRVVVQHFFKDRGDPKKMPSFSVDTTDFARNRLLIARTYFDERGYRRTCAAIATEMDILGLVDEVESETVSAEIAEKRRGWVRGFPEWSARFQRELGRMFANNLK